MFRLREDAVPLLLDNRVSLFTNGTVELVNVTHEDSGAYTCSVDNTDISITANLEVFSKGVFSFLLLLIAVYVILLLCSYEYKTPS